MNIEKMPIVTVETERSPIVLPVGWRSPWQHWGLIQSRRFLWHPEQWGLYRPSSSPAGWPSPPAPPSYCLRRRNYLGCKVILYLCSCAKKHRWQYVCVQKNILLWSHQRRHSCGRGCWRSARRHLRPVWADRWSLQGRPAASLWSPPGWSYRRWSRCSVSAAACRGHLYTLYQYTDLVPVLGSEWQRLKWNLITQYIYSYNTLPLGAEHTSVNNV